MLKQAGISLISVSLLLAGCGGSSSSSDTPANTGLTYDGPTTAVAITSTTEANTVAGTILTMESESSVLGDAATIIPIGVAIAPGVRSAPSFDMSNLGAMAKQYANIALTADTSSSSLLAGVVSQTDVINCTDGGTISFTATLTDPNTPTIGDSISMVFSNCIELATSDKTNGSVTLTINSFILNQDGTLADFAANFAFGNLKNTKTTSGDYTWINGGFSAAFSGDGINTAQQIAITGSSLVIEEMTANVTEQLRLTSFSFVDTFELNGGGFTIDHDYTVACTQLNGSVTVEMTTPFNTAVGDINPSTGVVVVTGALGAKVRLTALSDATNVFIEYDLDGLAGYELSTTKLWSDL